MRFNKDSFEGSESQRGVWQPQNLLWSLHFFCRQDDNNNRHQSGKPEENIFEQSFSCKESSAADDLSPGLHHLYQSLKGNLNVGTRPHRPQLKTSYDGRFSLARPCVSALRRWSFITHAAISVVVKQRTREDMSLDDYSSRPQKNVLRLLSSTCQNHSDPPQVLGMSLSPVVARTRHVSEQLSSVKHLAQRPLQDLVDNALLHVHQHRLQVQGNKRQWATTSRPKLSRTTSARCAAHLKFKQYYFIFWYLVSDGRLPDTRVISYFHWPKMMMVLFKCDKQDTVVPSRTVPLPPKHGVFSQK